MSAYVVDSDIIDSFLRSFFLHSFYQAFFFHVARLFGRSIGHQSVNQGNVQAREAREAYEIRERERREVPCRISGSRKLSRRSDFQNFRICFFQIFRLLEFRMHVQREDAEGDPRDRLYYSDVCHCF